MDRSWLGGGPKRFIKLRKALLEPVSELGACVRKSRAAIVAAEMGAIRLRA